MKKNYKVAIIQRLVPHYRVPFFELLNKRLAAEKIDLEVYYSETPEAFRPTGVHLPAQFGFQVPSLWLLVFKRYVAIQFLPIRRILSSDVIVVEHSANSPMVMFMVFLLKLKTKNRSKLVLWSHGGFSLQKRSYWNTIVDFLFFDRCSSIFFYTQKSHSNLAEMAQTKKIRILNNTVLPPDGFDKDIVLNSLEQSATQNLKVIFIGGLNASKRPGMLIEIIKASSPRVIFDIVGDGPGLRDMKFALSELPNVNFWGHLEGEKKEVKLSEADLLLMPGMVGLASVDCMFYGVPTLTTCEEIHSPEIAYLKNNYNALFVNGHTEDFILMLETLLTDKEKLKGLQRHALETASTLTIDHMVEEFSQGCMAEIAEISR